MATLKNTVAANWTNHTIAVATSSNAKPAHNVWTKYLAFVDGQKDNRTLWFFIILSVHAAAFLPIPVLLIGYLNAPVGILGVTMVSFFANFVANMGGSGIRITLSFFFTSIIIHLAMIMVVIAL